ncbi:uncharacterized protein B0I36DRAFT_391220 [Microdochium trichocladiopsis]|uniref:Uncharacterized protein n=1 Tax=Microdochium trichocladiopsis TaxID=1682393 RepID=A0A9P8YHH5_9PEZI|nr:uncharacterized protein B0I36DRAFT_391220 [Microdochium trichocladiopsis]KAH7040370.1 hypothetical protein B0I36DRAFT_391220 [Microdochium trichocladiopsis]
MASRRHCTSGDTIGTVAAILLPQRLDHIGGCISSLVPAQWFAVLPRAMNLFMSLMMTVPAFHGSVPQSYGLGCACIIGHSGPLVSCSRRRLRLSGAYCRSGVEKCPRVASAVATSATLDSHAYLAKGPSPWAILLPCCGGSPSKQEVKAPPSYLGDNLAAYITQGPSYTSADVVPKVLKLPNPSVIIAHTQKLAAERPHLAQAFQLVLETCQTQFHIITRIPTLWSLQLHPH